MKEEARAREALSSGRILRVVFEPSGRTLYLALSRERDRYYLMIPGRYCSCGEFFFNVLLRRTANACHHLMALSMALSSGGLREVRADDREYPSYLRRIFRGALL